MSVSSRRRDAPRLETSPAARSSSGPVFIGGLDRSGKTTMRAFLASHPRIAIPPVGSNMETYFYGRFGKLHEASNLERCLGAMLRYKHVRTLDPDVDRIRREFALGPPTYERLFSLFLIHYAERLGKPRWGAQSGLIERSADHLFDAYPEVRVVHMVRDPRDRYAASLEAWPNGRGRAGGAAARWRYSARLALRNRRRYGDRYAIVRFEDLVLDTERVVRDLCGFLGERFEPRMLEMADAPEHRRKLLEGATAAGPVALSSAFIGRYRDVVPSHERAFLERHTARLMRRLGYPADAQRLRARERARLAADWPNQFARMTAWRVVETAQQRFPSIVPRTPDRRMIVEPSEAAS